jgi:hypothetical protein
MAKLMFFAATVLTLSMGEANAVSRVVKDVHVSFSAIYRY